METSEGHGDVEKGHDEDEAGNVSEVLGAGHVGSLWV